MNKDSANAGNPVRKEGPAEHPSIAHSVKDLPEQQKIRSGQAMLSLYERIFHHIYDAVMLTDMNGEIVEVNARAEHNFRWQRDDLRSMNVMDLISGADDNLITTINQNVTDERYVVVEAVCVKSDDSEFPADIVINKLSGPEGEMLIFFFRDITVRKEAENELAAANERNTENEKIRARMDTVSTLVREINNPLQVLIFKAESDGDKEIIKQINRVTRVIEQLQTSDPLPVAVDENGSSVYKLPAVERAEACEKGKLLVCDDEDMLRTMFVESLSQAYPSMEIDTASDGKQAVELFKQKHHGFIIMDLSMPVMNGEEAYDHIQQICEDADMQSPAFLFCTGFVPSEKVMTIISGDESPHACIRKPFTTGDLLRVVKERFQLMPDATF